MTDPRVAAVAAKLAELVGGRGWGAVSVELLAAADGAIVFRSLSEWHEDQGPMLWWRFPVDEPPYVGSPIDTDWPGYHTHFTPLPALPKEPVS